MHAAFKIHHSHTCRRCPERFSSNSQLHRHIKARHVKKTVGTSHPSAPTAEKPPEKAPPTPPTSQLASPALSAAPGPPFPASTPVLGLTAAPRDEKPLQKTLTWSQVVFTTPPSPESSPGGEISAPTAPKPAPYPPPHERLI